MPPKRSPGAAAAAPPSAAAAAAAAATGANPPPVAIATPVPHSWSGQALSAGSSGLFGDDDDADGDDDAGETKARMRGAPTGTAFRATAAPSGVGAKRRSAPAVDDDYGAAPSLRRRMHGNGDGDNDDDDGYGTRIGGRGYVDMSRPYALREAIEKSARGNTVADRKKRSIYDLGPLPGPRRHPGSIDASAMAFGEGTVTTRAPKSKPIVALSRNDPQSHQSLVVRTMKFDYGLHALRSKNAPENMICPLGPATNFSIMEGMIIMSSNERKVKRLGNIHYPQQSGFAALDGMAKNTWVHIIGVAQGKVEVKGDASYNAATFTVITQGTVTIKQTGRARINAGDRVACVPIPVKMTIGTAAARNLTEVPAIREHGVPDSMFRPALFAFHHNNTTTQCEELAHIIQFAVKQHIGADLAEFKTRGAPAIKGLFNGAVNAGITAMDDRFVVNEYGETFQPIQVFGTWLAIDCALRHIAFMVSMTVLVGGPQALKQAVLEKALEAKKREGDFYHFIESAQVHGLTATGKVTTEDWILATKDETDEMALFLQLALSLPRIFGEYQRIAIGQQHEWIKQYIIGTASSSADPGMDIDICLGFGRGM